MCQIQAKYFTKNGSADWGNCAALPEDRINVEAVVTFSGSEIGKEYKCELKIKTQIGEEYKIFTPLRPVGSTETFTSPDFPRPVPFGTYQLLWVTVYDAMGNTVCSG